MGSSVIPPDAASGSSAQANEEANKKSAAEQEAFLKKKKEEDEKFQRKNEIFREIALAYLAEKGIKIPEYYKRDDPDQDRSQRAQGGLSLSSGEPARPPMTAGTYHAYGKARFDLILDENGTVTTAWAPKEDRPSDGPQWDSFFSFNKVDLRKEKIRAMIEFQIARGCFDLEYDCSSKLAMKEFMEIADQYPVQYKVNGKNSKKRLGEDADNFYMNATGMNKEWEEILVAREKKSQANYSALADTIKPQVYVAKKTNDYAKDIGGLNSNNKIDQPKLEAALKELESKTPDQKATAAEAQIKDLQSRLDKLEILKKALDKDVEKLGTRLQSAKTKEKAQGFLTMFDETIRNRDNLVAAMAAEHASLQTQRDLCVQMVAKLDAGKKSALEAKIPTPDKMTEIKDLIDKPMIDPDSFKKKVEERKQQIQKIEANAAQPIRSGPAPSSGGSTR